jgi:single-strand DNA-binding protein
MASFNKVIIAGNLTRDPELRYTPKGTAVAKIGLAVNRTWKTESGEQKEEVTFIDVDVFGRQAEVLAQYMKKGRELLVEGRLKLDTWEDKNTKQKVSKLKVVLESFSFIGGGGNREGAMGGGGGGGYSGGGSRPMASSAPVAPPEPSEPDMPPQEPDDVPF